MKKKNILVVATLPSHSSDHVERLICRIGGKAEILVCYSEQTAQGLIETATQCKQPFDFVIRAARSY